MPNSSIQKARKKPWNNTIVALLQLTNMCIFLAICFFCAEYQRTQLRVLDVPAADYEDRSWLQKWSSDDNHCILMFDQLVAIGASIGGIGAVSCLFGLFAVCARPARKCLHYFALGMSIAMYMTALGFGIAMEVEYDRGNLIFNTGWDTGCYPDIEGEEYVAGKSASRVSSYCTDSMHPNLYKTMPDECPQTYHPAVKQLNAYMAQNYTAKQSRLFMANYKQCLDTGVCVGNGTVSNTVVTEATCRDQGICNGCMEAGLMCKQAVDANVLKAQHWDAMFLIIAGAVGLVWSLAMAYFVQFEMKHKPVEDIKQDDKTESQALLNQNSAYDAPKAVTDHP